MDLQITELNNTLKNVRSLRRSSGSPGTVRDRLYPAHCNCANRYGATLPPQERVSAEPLRPVGTVARFATLGR